MNEVFILGAGFSKAISDQMPLTMELSQHVFKCYKQKDAITSEIREMMEEDFEKALTFLAQNKPWLREPDNLRHKALYLDLTHVIRGIIHQKCREPMVWCSDQTPSWLAALIAYWHANRCAVITLNYDTLIERVASSFNWQNSSISIPTGKLYSIRMTPADRRGESIPVEASGAKSIIETFSLIKLHGSINWFYSGRSTFFGEELFYVPCIGGVIGEFDAFEGQDPEQSHWSHITDKTILIIPPILDKSSFFQHESLRSMWFQASQAIKNASRIICMGYSLPSSDLTMAQFLKSSAPSSRIPYEIIDVSQKREHFAKVLGKQAYDFKQNRADVNCVPNFVVSNCIPDKNDRDYVIRTTLWKKSSC